MKRLRNRFSSTLITIVTSIWMSSSYAEGTNGIDGLLTELANSEHENWEQTEEKIIDLWSRSGSSGMDLLLERGQDALDREDYESAMEHFGALTDHAPDFAEGWNMRATTFFLIDEYGLAIQYIGRALALNPKHFGALNGLGVILEQIGEEERALAAYEAAFEINPHRESLAEAIDRLKLVIDGRSI